MKGYSNLIKGRLLSVKNIDHSTPSDESEKISFVMCVPVNR